VRSETLMPSLRSSPWMRGARHKGSARAMVRIRSRTSLPTGSRPAFPFGLPKYLSSHNDPLYRFHQWQANLRILEVTEVKSIPYVPVSHPFVERLIGTLRREYLDHMLFWTTADLENKLLDFRTYFNPSHAYLTGRANAGYARVTTNRKSPLISLATSLPILISDTSGCLTFQRLGLTAASGQPLQKSGMESSGVRVLGCSAFRRSDRFTATVSIRQAQQL
jgi:hypothetical protein